MRKSIGTLFVLAFILTTNTCYAKNFSKDINKIISNSNIKKGCISISIKSLDNKKTKYEYNQTVPIPPASTQKLITTLPALKALGENYKFETKLYKDNNDNYLIVLGADPYLKNKDLKNLTKCISTNINSISIDDTIIDKKEWGEGWQWDDNTNPLMPKFGPYNIDKNIIKIYLQPTEQGAPANIILDKEYPITFVNNIITSNTTNYKMEKSNIETPEVVKFEGCINKTVTVSTPITNLKKYFKLRLADALIDNCKSNDGIYKNNELTEEYQLINTISHDINQAKIDILKNSDNMVSETIFKLAGGKYKNTTGSFETGKEMFDAYCKNMNLDNSQIHIVDASGVSKNNLMISDFMTEFLIINKKELEPIMATSGEGTLQDRLLYLKGNLKAKTGTLSNISALTGYLSTQNGHKYAFCIMINDAKSKDKDKKLLEDNIIKTLYLKG